jgi:hypothetical protein
MSTELTVAAVVILTILMGVSLRRQRQIRTTDKQAEARRHTPAAKAQRERSEHRRARVRADHEESAQSNVTSPSLNGGHRLTKRGVGTTTRRGG